MGHHGVEVACGELWHPGQSLAARCRASTVVGRAEAADDAHDVPQEKCTCGVYAAKNLDHLRTMGYVQHGICGEVYLWGTVVEHKLGWRARYACPKNLFLPLEMLPISMGMLEARLNTLVAYGCDIHVLGEEGNVPLWIRGSGYDAVGLDLLVPRCKSWYARRGQERRIKRGDRVAVLGQGIAVVEQAGDREVYAMLWSTNVVRVDRRRISWDNQNMRWETSPLACV